MLKLLPLMLKEGGGEEVLTTERKSAMVRRVSRRILVRSSKSFAYWKIRFLKFKRAVKTANAELTGSKNLKHT